MATLTPGVLLKLLQSMTSAATAAGDHYRSAVLQVTAIVPVPGGSDDLWPARGFYLQLSDSAYSTYVSLSAADADAVLSSRPQLGQLLHVARLLPAHPVPIAAGVRLVPPGRPLPFSGCPDPLLVVSDPSRPDGFLIQPAPDSSPPVPAEIRSVLSPKENIAAAPAPAPKSRFSSPAAVKFTRRDPSPAPAKGPRSRPSSPVPSKCEVPSLMAAKEDSRRTAREPAIIVPSRYRQPSPVGRRVAASPAGRRASMSPGRRLSGGLKMSPASGDSKKKMAAVVAGISKVSDALVARSARKSWEDPGPKSGDLSETKKKPASKSKGHHRTLLTAQVAMSRRLSDVDLENSGNNDASTTEKSRPSHKIEYFSMPEKSICAAPNMVFHDRKWTDGSVPIDNLSENLVRLGKEVLQCRNIASAAAAEALEQAWATDSIFRSLSMFSDLCSSSNAGNPLPTINWFLSIYDDVVKCNTVAESLANKCNSSLSKERCKSVSLWVEAALATDLRVLSLLNDGECSPSINSARASLSKRKSTLAAKVSANPAAGAWSKGCGIIQAFDLASTLRHEMQTWFLKFVDEALEVGFRLFTDNLEDRNSKDKDKDKVAVVLSHFKRVNAWLDCVGKGPEEEAVKRLKQRIYGFVITHVDCI